MMEGPGQNAFTFLICTVGGTPQPVIKAIKFWKPVRICFVHTFRSKVDIETRIVPEANGHDLNLDPGRYGFLELPDEQDLASCLDRLRRLTPDVEEWVARNDNSRVVVDFTGGTKCMSAAIALQARQWPCLFSYIGGSRRTKDGVGVVETGSETVVHHENPWNALGHQTVEDFMVLFDQHAFVAAKKVANMAKMRIDRPDRKREFAVLEQLAKAFDAWDRFDHRSCSAAFDNVAKSSNDLRAVLGNDKGDQVIDGVTHLAGYFKDLCQAKPPSHLHVFDLLANARRRKDEKRLDDAMARLYRAIEAMAQVVLKERHGIESTERIPLDNVPEPIPAEWTSRARDGIVALGLQDAYVLLLKLDDSLGHRFKEANLDGTQSHLAVRNRSILAHGFDQVPSNALDKLWDATLELAGIKEADLPSFPTLGAKTKY